MCSKASQGKRMLFIDFWLFETLILKVLPCFPANLKPSDPFNVFPISFQPPWVLLTHPLLRTSLWSAIRGQRQSSAWHYRSPANQYKLWVGSLRFQGAGKHSLVHPRVGWVDEVWTLNSQGNHKIEWADSIRAIGKDMRVHPVVGACIMLLIW